MTPAAPRISVCIVCRNEADRLEPCLVSVAEWADEVLVLDLESTDGSADLARRYGASVFSHPVVPVVEAVRNTIARHAEGEWILALDPDERAAPGLGPELRRQAARQDVDVVSIPVMNFDFGYAASHPMHRYDPKPRFYRRSAVSWPTFPNALPQVEPERLHALPHRDDLVIRHERNRTVPEAIERVVRYAPAQAQAMVDAGEVFTASAMLRTLGGKAHRQLIVARPWRDGTPGLVRALVLLAFHVYVWANFWERSGAARTARDDRDLARIGRVVDVVLLPGRVVRRALRPARRRM